MSSTNAPSDDDLVHVRLQRNSLVEKVDRLSEMKLAEVEKQNAELESELAQSTLEKEELTKEKDREIKELEGMLAEAQRAREDEVKKYKNLSTVLKEQFSAALQTLNQWDPEHSSRRLGDRHESATSVSVTAIQPYTPDSTEAGTPVVSDYSSTPSNANASPARASSDGGGARPKEKECTTKDAEIKRCKDTINALEAQQVALKMLDASKEEEIGRLKGAIANLESKLKSEVEKCVVSEAKVHELEEIIKKGQAERKRYVLFAELMS